MKRYKKYYTEDGMQIAMWLNERLYITQGENGQYSHQGIHAIDYVGYTKQAENFAPFDCKCVAFWNIGGNGRIFESTKEVLCADGVRRFVHFGILHDSIPLAKIGQVFEQGDVIGHTGVAGNVTGDHTHLICGNDHYEGFINLKNGNREFKNFANVYNIFFINDTNVENDLNYPFKAYDKNFIESSSIDDFTYFLYKKQERQGLCRIIIHTA